MRVLAHLAAASLALGAACATPVRRAAEDTMNDMDAVLAGTAPCTAVGALFARGTFDSGNIGVWVGPAFLRNLKASLPEGMVAAQGVDPNAYGATLDEYLAQNGSTAGAAAMASAATAYAAKCPDTILVLSGWSQGALVAHKALEQLDNTTLSKVGALVTFGDPWRLFGGADPPLPAANVQSYCVTGTIFDPLCAQLPSDFHKPTSLGDLLGPFKDLPSIAQGADEVAAAASLVVQFPKQLAESWSSFVHDLNPDDFTRLLLTPQHFTYGNNGMAGEAGTWLTGVNPPSPN